MANTQDKTPTPSGSKNINQLITNVFARGMDLDSYPTDIQDGFVRFRLNGERVTNDFVGAGDVNERGTVEFVNVPENIVGYTLIDERNWAVLFSTDGGKDTIGYVDLDTKEYKEIMNAQEFGCAWNFIDCEWLSVGYDYISGCNELKLYFSSNWTYYNVNVDEMLDPERKAGLLENLIPENENQCGITNCDYFKSFTCICGARTNVSKAEKGGYNLQAGVYQVALQLVDANGSATNIFHASRPINIGSEDNIPGQRSQEYITGHFSNLDCRYHLARIIIIKTIGGSVSASIVAEKSYTNGQVSFDYYGETDRDIPIDPSRISQYGRTLLEGKDLFIHNNRMWYYNLKPDKNPDIQEKVLNNTSVEMLINSVPYEDVVKFGYKSLMRGENYLFAISYNVCGKGNTPAFLLSPTGGGLNGPKQTGIDNSEKEPMSLEYEDDRVYRVKGDTVAGLLSGSSCSGGDCYTTTCSDGTCGDIVTRGQSQASNNNSDSEDSTAPNAATGDLGDALQSAVSNMNTLVDEICYILNCPESDCNCGTEGEECSDCISNCDECECDYRRKAASECSETMPAVEQAQSSLIQWITGLSKDDPNPAIENMSLKDASLKLVDDAVNNAEQKVFTRGSFYGTAPNGEFSEVKPPESDSDVNEGDNATDTDHLGRALFNSHVKEISRTPFDFVEDGSVYPDTLNCHGDFVYGKYAGKPVKLFKVPGADEIPLVTTHQKGVISKWAPENTEWSNTYVNLIGLKITDIYIPTEEELGGKLCEDNPFTILMVERTWSNSTVMAKGPVFGTFEGVTNGRRYAFGRHAVNSKELIDRFINNNGSRKGHKGNGKRFLFNSLDTAVYHMGLSVDYVVPEMRIYGDGFRYGLNAIQTPPQDPLAGKRGAMRGARSASNLNYSNPASGAPITVTGITYAQGNRVVTNPEGIDYPLMNRYRESSVYFQVDGNMTNLEDFSFTGDVLNATAYIPGNQTEYVSLRRDIPDQYGSPINQAYISTDLEGHAGSIFINSEGEKRGKISGICGDVYVGYNTLKRTSYISEKVGNEFNIPAMNPNKTKWRSVCDTPEDWDQTTLGYYFPNKLPLNGDTSDAKNWAGLHTKDDEFTLSHNQVINDPNEPFPRSEYYYPRVLTHLVHYWGESKVCPWLKQTGEGSQLRQQDVYYPKLKDLEFDPYMTGTNFDECFMTGFRYEFEYPSKLQMLKKALLKGIINYALPALDGIAMAFVEKGVGVGAYLAVQPMLVGVWTYLKEDLLSDDKLDEMVGIEPCHTDEEGILDEGAIKGWKDNYVEYNTDYSTPNRINVYRGIPDPYYTCDCDDVINGETSAEIKYSNQRLLGSFIDAYINVSPENSVIVPSKFGKLKKLFVESGRFYGHTDKQFLLLQEGKLSVPTVEGKSLSLGGGGLLDIPEGVFQTVPEGFIGLQDPNASHTTPFGQVFVDSKARAIYLMQGGKPDRISDRGLSRFFWEKLPFACTDCRDEKNGQDYLFGISYENKLLYFTKRDCDCSFTVSYDLVGKTWHSFHSFVPDFYIWDRDNMFSINNSKMWQHGAGPYQTYYGSYYPYIIEFASKAKNQGPIEYKSTIMNTIATVEGQLDAKHTFTDMGMYTLSQSSGMNKLVLNEDMENQWALIKKFSYVPVDRDGRNFKYNQVINKASYGEPILTDTCTYPTILPVSGANEFENQFYDDYIITRLQQYNEDKDIQLITRNVSLLVEQRQDG